MEPHDTGWSEVHRPGEREQHFTYPMSEVDLTDEYVVSLLNEYEDSSFNSTLYQEPLELLNHLRGESNESSHDIVAFQGLPNDELSTSETPTNGTEVEDILSASILFPAEKFTDFIQTENSPSVSTEYETPQYLMSSQYDTRSNVAAHHKPASTSTGNTLDYNYPQLQTNCDTSLTCIPSILSFPEGFVSSEKTPAQKGRRCTRKTELETSNSLAPQPKPKKRKVYEIDKPFDDRELERKRKNAVNAKRHRDLQKEEREILERQIADVSIEREILKYRNEELERKLTAITKKLEALRKIFEAHPMARFPVPSDELQNY